MAAEEEQHDPLQEINNLRDSEAEFLEPEARNTRRLVLNDLKDAYIKGVIEEDVSAAESAFTEMLGRWSEHQEKNLDEPDLFTDEELVIVRKYVDEIDKKIFPEENRRKEDIDRLLGFLDEDRE